jgi:hypothetical protein
MSDPNPAKKSFDISSATADKALIMAERFVDALVMPGAREVGLLIHDRVQLWRLKNQIQVVVKAKAYCEANGVEPGKISPKLLVPLLEGAGLEEDVELQDKWAILLSNLADSEQNVQNHVFPYVLGQISANEFAVLAASYRSWCERKSALSIELEEHNVEFPRLERALKEALANLEKEIKSCETSGEAPSVNRMLQVRKMVDEKKAELAELRWEPRRLQFWIEQDGKLQKRHVKEYEVANLTRLGLVRSALEVYAPDSEIEIPPRDEYASANVEVQIHVELETETVLTELGVKFVEACTEKSKRTASGIGE